MSESVYPTLAVDEAGAVYIAYRDFISKDGRAALVLKGSFSAPIVFTATPQDAPADIPRYNPHLAAAKTGGVYVVWQGADGKVYLRAIRLRLPG